jgi:formylglycine-generating enzyme required for sulfatase activity
LEEALARLLGLEPIPPPPAEVLELPSIEPAGEMTAPTDVPEPAEVATGFPFWYPKSLSIHEPTAQGVVTVTAKKSARGSEPAAIPVSSLSLTSNASLLTRLRRDSAFERTTAELDVERVVERLSRGHLLESIPRRSRRSWGLSILVVKDRHDRLAPYWKDQDDVARLLERVYPRKGVQVAIVDEGSRAPVPVGPDASGASFPPAPGTTALALSDLGCLDQTGDRSRELWLQWGKRYREAGGRTVALVPCDAGSVPAHLAREWAIVPWEEMGGKSGSGPGPEATTGLAERVLVLLSFALRVDPELIRVVRRLLTGGRRGAGVESLVWQSDAFQSRHCLGATYQPEQARELRVRIGSEPVETRRQVYELMREIRQGGYEGVWHAERLGLEREGAAVGLPAEDLLAAASWFAENDPLLKKLAAREGLAGAHATWSRRVLVRLPGAAYQGIAAGALHAMWSRSSSGAERPPDGLDPARMPVLEEDVRTLELRQDHQGLLFRFDQDGAPPGSLVGSIRARHLLIKVEPSTSLPPWVAESDKDQYGHWRSFQVNGVSQLLRWIPPGEFLMGSLEAEEGRDTDEGPQHLVRITRGFWMFDTPCKQALWEAVMGGKPSRFQDPESPVEQVSWTDCQKFVSRLNRLLVGAAFALPSEAQWEYACRAGSETARYCENLDQIAWYWDNSKEHTHPVGGKAPNGWGLYDVLGNVWEWCLDSYDSEFYRRSPVNDPFAPASPPVRCLIRGGSWLNTSRLVRASYREHSVPSNRSGNLGFRCAEFQSSGPQETGPGWPAWVRTDQDRVSFSCVIPVRLSSDVESLVVDVMTKPAWASAMGRDKFGLWAEMRLEAKSRGRRKSTNNAAGQVRQRLRWIPPGSFLMGSPASEVGRYEGEGPQHEVAIQAGYWIFDTPCTQALWQAVMGKNPSRFRSPTRPVEQVSWNDCQGFLVELNKRLNGLSLSLPSEAQWEYACRAGTSSATYAGDLEILGANNAPVLDAIAWYGGNCGVGFELKNGYDISDWPEKQYKDRRGGTHPVSMKLPNPWGLHDMLGNVWEWCADEWRRDDWQRLEPGATDASAHRVIRGGSWDDDAQDVRAAYRYLLDPSTALVYLGFRCAEFGEGRELEPEGGQVVSRSQPAAVASANVQLS